MRFDAMLPLYLFQLLLLRAFCLLHIFYYARAFAFAAIVFAAADLAMLSRRACLLRRRS